jgi:hypothetical protein
MNDDTALLFLGNNAPCSGIQISAWACIEESTSLLLKQTIFRRNILQSKGIDGFYRMHPFLDQAKKLFHTGLVTRWFLPALIGLVGRAKRSCGYSGGKIHICVHCGCFRWQGSGTNGCTDTTLTGRVEVKKWETNIIGFSKKADA